jgi:Fe-S-cluster containining protein
MKRVYRNGRLVQLPTLPVTSCAGCMGSCCRHLGTPPGFAAFFSPYGIAAWAVDSPDHEIVKHMPEEVQAELREYYRAVFAGEIEDRTRVSDVDIPCLWLDLETGLCRHHEWRPTTCRDFAIGSPNCLDARRRYRIPLPVADG